MTACRRRFGNVFALRLPMVYSDRVVFVADPDEAKSVFAMSGKTLHAGEGNAILEPVVGQHSLLALDEEAHLSERRSLLPHFHRDALRRQHELMVEIAADELAAWPAGERFSVLPRAQQLTLRIIVRVLFGMSGEVGRQMHQALREMFDAAILPLSVPVLQRAPAGPWKRYLRLRQRVDQLLWAELDRRQGRDGGDERDVLSMLLQATTQEGKTSDRQRIRDELITLLAAGHETTATTLAWSLERLARHPRVLARIRDELADGNQAYLDLVVKETLRSRPALTSIARLVKEPLVLGGYRVEPGEMVALSIYLVHHRPDLYPEPERFWPERFADGDSDTYTWLPFGGGIRRCLGAAFAQQEMRIVLAELFQRFDLMLEASPGERRRRRSITTVPHRGGQVVLRKRGLKGARAFDA